jgi:hypothetical protein
MLHLRFGNNAKKVNRLLPNISSLSFVLLRRSQFKGAPAMPQPCAIRFSNRSFLGVGLTQERKMGWPEISCQGQTVKTVFSNLWFVEPERMLLRETATALSPKREEGEHSIDTMDWMSSLFCEDQHLMFISSVEFRFYLFVHKLKPEESEKNITEGLTKKPARKSSPSNKRFMMMRCMKATSFGGRSADRRLGNLKRR